MQIIKSITARQIFKEYPRSKNSFGVVNFGVMGATLEPDFDSKIKISALCFV